MGNSSLAALKHGAEFIHGQLDWLVLTVEMKSYQAFCIEFVGWFCWVLVGFWGFCFSKSKYNKTIENFTLACLPIVSIWGVYLYRLAISNFLQKSL